MARKKSKSDHSSRISRGKPSDQSEISQTGAGKKGRRGSKKGGKDEHDTTEGTTMQSQMSTPSKGRKKSKSLTDLTDDTSKVEKKENRRKSQSATDLTQHKAEKSTTAKKSKREPKSESKAGGKKEDTKKKRKSIGSNCSCHDCACQCCEDVRAGLKQREPSQTRVETVLRIDNYDSGPGAAGTASEPMLRQGGDASEANITVGTHRSSSHGAAGSDSDVVVNIRVVFRDSHGSERSLTSVVRSGALGSRNGPRDTLARRRSSGKENFLRRMSASQERVEPPPRRSSRPSLPEPPLLEALQEEIARMMEMGEGDDIPSQDNLARRRNSSKERLKRRKSSSAAPPPRRASRASSIREMLEESQVLEALQYELPNIPEMIEVVDRPALEQMQISVSTQGAAADGGVTVQVSVNALNGMSKDNLARRRSSRKESLRRRKSSSVARFPRRTSRTSLPEPPLLEALQKEIANITEMGEEEDISLLEQIKRSYSRQGSAAAYAGVNERERRGSYSLPPDVRGTGSAECQAIAELEALSVHVVKKVKQLKEIHLDNKAMRAAAEREI